MSLFKKWRQRQKEQELKDEETIKTYDEMGLDEIPFWHHFQIMQLKQAFKERRERKKVTFWFIISIPIAIAVTLLIAQWATHLKENWFLFAVVAFCLWVPGFAIVGSTIHFIYKKIKKANS